ncbi:MAG: hypothetical protein AAFX54_00040 [Pseudomonadota bacterium]
MPETETGFALTDTLIAAVIAAGVAISCAEGLSAASRTANAANQLDQLINEAQVIEARLSAGITDEALLDGLPDWNKAEEVFKPKIEKENRLPYEARLFRIMREAPPTYSFDYIIITEAQL